MTATSSETFTRLAAKRQEQMPQALARLVLVALFIALWIVLWIARVPMPVPFFIALLLEAAFFLIYLRVVSVLPTVRAVSFAQYGMLAVEVVFHTTMVYFLGGISWLGSFAYVFGLIFTNAFLDLKKGLIYTTGACAGFALLILLEATGTIPHYQYLGSSEGYADRRVVGTTLICATGVFYSIYLWSTWVGQQLRRERDGAIRAQEDLLAARKDLEHANQDLERRVRARTVELELANAALRDADARLRTVITNAPIALFALDTKGAFTLLEGKAIDMIGVDPTQVIGRSALEVYTGAPAVLDAIHRSLEGEPSTTIAQAGTVVLEAQLEPMRDDRGNVVGVIGVATDITDRTQAEFALRASEERMQTVVSHASVVLFAVDKDGVFTLLEGRGLEALGQRTGEAVGTSVFVVCADQPQIMDNVRRALTGEEFTDTVAIGDIVFQAHYMPVRAPSGHVDGVIGVATDITERKRAEEALRNSEQILKSTIESTADGILVVNNSGNVVYANQKFADMWHIPAPLMQQRNDAALLDFVLSQLQDPDNFLARVKELYASAREDLDVLDFQDGCSFERYSRPLMLGGTVAGRVWSFRDITEQRRAARELATQARHDPLTGVLNRRAGLLEIDQRIAAAEEGQRNLAIFMLDLDSFKAINDTHSHEMGDAALIRLSDVLMELFGEGTVCRLGGDEFEMAIDGIDVDEALALAEKFHESLRRSIGDEQLGRLPAFSATIGIASFPEDGASARQLARRADEAMYAGKAGGGDTSRAWRYLERLAA